MDTYALSVSLPFPVFEKKGTAKYDKVAKTLTVTMPVQPPTIPEVESIPSAVALTDNEEKDTETYVGEVSITDAEKKLEKNEVMKEEVMKSSNSRWVGVEKGLVTEELRIKNEELKKEIKMKSLPVPPSASVLPSDATLSKLEKEGKEKQSGLSSSSPPAPPSVTVAAPNPPPSSTGVSSGTDTGVGSGFDPCNFFAGRREGFLFKRGELGQGYYLDISNSPLPAPVPSSRSITVPQSAPPFLPQSSKTSQSSQSNSLNYTSKPCPLEFRQTNQAIAVLIQIPSILLDSATVSFNDYTVDVEFRALGSDSRIFGVDGAHVNPIIATCASVARVTGNNTAINANISSDKTEISDVSIKTLSPEKIDLTDLYGIRLTSEVRLNKNLCKYDIASKNMVLVLAKEEEGFYEESEGSKLLSLVSFSAGGKGSHICCFTNLIQSNLFSFSFRSRF